MVFGSPYDFGTIVEINLEMIESLTGGEFEELKG